MASNKAILDVLTALTSAVQAQNERLDALEAPKAAAKSAKAVAAKPQRTVVEGDPQLASLAGTGLKRSKISIMHRCADHSQEALITYMNAGGQAARAFMKGDTDAEVGLDANGSEFTIKLPALERNSANVRALVPNRTTHQYATRLLTLIGKGPISKPAGKRGRPTGSTAGEANRRAASGKAGRPLSMEPAAVQSREWRAKEKEAGRDPYRKR